MKLHDLKPALGSRRPRTRVGRGIAAGQGKTAGRGTKGQKSRAGASIPAWFEGGQTPIHVRVPKLRGFNNQRFRTEYQVVNVGQISAYAEAGRFGVEAEPLKSTAKRKAADESVLTINAEVLAQAGLIRGDSKPLKVLGQGEVSQKLFVAADAFSASARQKIEAAGGFIQELAEPKPEPEPKAKATPKAKAAPDADTASEPEAAPEPEAKADTAPEPEPEPAAAEPAESAESAAADETQAAAPAKPKRRSKSQETA